MSELTICNYCNLASYKQRAKLRGAKIVLRPSQFMNGINVFEVLLGEKLADQAEMVEPKLPPHRKGRR